MKAWRRYLRFWGPDIDADVNDELQFHVEARITEYEARGFSRDQAVRMARERFGDVSRIGGQLVAHDRTKQRRADWCAALAVWLDRRAADFRVALRGLRRSPSVAVSAVLVLSVAIAMAATMVTVVRAILLERLPVHDQDRVITLRLESKDGAEVPIWSGAELAQLQRASRTIRDIGAVYHAGVYTYPLLDGRHPVLSDRVMVSGNFFDVLGARPVAGRLLETADDATVTHDLVHPPIQPLVLSHKAWLTWFGGDVGIVGRHLTNPYGPPNYQIVGIAPAGLDFPIGVDYWVPMGNNMAAGPLVARLDPEATATSAREELPSLVRRIRTDTTTVAVVRARSFVNEIVGDVRPVLIALTAGAAILVLIACVNLGNLLLLRASARAHETAIRRAIGAANGDILVHFLAESVLLATLGAVGGVIGARLLVHVLPAIAPTRLPQLDLVSLSGAPGAAAVSITAVALFLFGVLPGITVATQDVATPLRGDARIAGQSRTGAQVRRVLVSAQVALAFLLVVGAGLLTRTMSRLAATQLGFNPEHLSFVAVSFPASRYLDSAQHAFPLGEDVLSRIRAIHGVMAASPVIIPPPLSPIGASVWRWHFVPVGARDIGEQGVAIPMEVGDSALFTTLGVRVVRGRAFTADDRDGSGAVVVVSESAANELWPGQDPIGRQLRILEGGGLPSGAGARTVVGVVHDLHYREFDVSSPTVFLPWRQAMWQGWLAIRTSGPLAAVLPDIRAAVAGLGPDINASQAQSMDELLATPLAVPRLGAFLLSAFGSVALLIAAIGLYAVIATAVRHRRHEIGVRLALGATAHAIRRQVVLDAMRIVAVGAFVGVGASLVMSRFATSLLHDVSPFDPLAFLGALVLLCAVAWAAAFVPAFRVARIDPTTVLRQE